MWLLAYINNYWRDRTDMGLCELLWSILLNCQLTTKLEMMHTLQAQVCGSISAHPGLPDQETKLETRHASKSQINQASWNRTVLKYVPEDQLKVHIYLSSLFSDFLRSHDLEKVMSLSLWLGVCRTPRVQVLGIEESENYYHLNT